MVVPALDVTLCAQNQGLDGTCSDPTVINFGEVPAGTEVTRHLRVTITGTMAAVLDAVAVDGLDVAATAVRFVPNAQAPEGFDRMPMMLPAAVAPGVTFHIELQAIGEDSAEPLDVSAVILTFTNAQTDTLVSTVPVSGMHQPCPSGFAICDADPLNGCETDTRSSVDHCNACDQACTFANAGAECVMGMCTMGTCDMDFEDCNGNPADGCEADTRVSQNHCGACGNRCVGLEQCTDSTCECPDMRLSTLTPAHYARSVPATTAVVATFTCGVAPASAVAASLAVKGNQSGLVDGTFAVGANPNVLRFTPDAGALFAGERVRIRIPAGIAARSGPSTAAPFAREYRVRTAPATALFTLHQQMATANCLGHTLLGDVDGDRDLDILAFPWSDSTCGGPIQLWRNNGSGTFTRVLSQPSAPEGVAAAALGDIDGDGDPDLLFYGYTEPLRVYRNSGSGVFSAGQTLAVPTLLDLDLVDVDLDGDEDVVAGAAPSDFYLRNDGSGVFTRVSANLNARPAFGVAPADIDGDGDFDLIYNHVPPREVTIWVNSGGTFTQLGAAQPSPGGGDLDVGDVDGDRDVDLVFPASSAPPQLWRNQGSGAFTVDAAAFPGSATGSFHDVMLDDFEGDSDLDAFVVQEYPVSDAPHLVYRNRGAGTFTRITAMTFPAGPSYQGAQGDVDGDGDLDVVLPIVYSTASQTEMGIQVWLNQ